MKNVHIVSEFSYDEKMMNFFLTAAHQYPDSYVLGKSISIFNKILVHKPIKLNYCFFFLTSSANILKH